MELAVREYDYLTVFAVTKSAPKISRLVRKGQGLYSVKELS